MRIDIRIEQIGGRGRPVIFFPDEVEHNRQILAFSEADGTTTASRSYMRGCKEPESPTEMSEAWAALERYSRRMRE